MRAFLTPLIQKNKFKLVLAALFVTSLGLMLSSNLSPHKVSADCSNDIICGGFSSPSDFINKVKGSTELQHIYAYSSYGLTSSMYNGFAGNTKQGTAYKNGDIYVNGQKIATNGASIGRLAADQGPGYFTLNINGNKYYGNSNQENFASNSLPVTVLYSNNGTPIFIVLNDCGNPMTFKLPPSPPKEIPPQYACVQMTGALTNTTNNTYTFHVTASAANGPTPAYTVFTFSDKQSKTVNMNGNTAEYSRSFSTGAGNSASYSAVATVYFKGLVAGQSYHATSPKCQLPIMVTIPYCSGLTGTVIDNNQYNVRFTATAVPNGRKLKSATFVFGDGKTATVNATSATAVTTTHTYSSGNYNASATLQFTGTNGVITSRSCAALCTSNTKGCVQECKPGVPVGDVRCQVCQYDSSLPANSPQCTPPCTNNGDTTNGATPCTTPTSLPNTGAGDTIAIFSAVVVAGFVLYRHLLYRKHKAAFAAAELGTSALPLADPTAPTDPLRDTPLAQKAKRSFRRRQF